MFSRFESKIMRQITIAVVLLISLVAASCSLEAGDSQISAPSYTEKDFTVGVSEKHTIQVDVGAGQIIEGDFSVSGQEDYIDFYIEDPFGSLLFDVHRAVGSLQFTAEATGSGVHTLYFDNSFSWGTSRQIALRYRVR